MAEKESLSIIIWYVNKKWVKMTILKRWKKGPFQGVKYGKNEDVAKYVIKQEAEGIEDRVEMLWI